MLEAGNGHMTVEEYGLDFDIWVVMKVTK